MAKDSVLGTCKGMFPLTPTFWAPPRPALRQGGREAAFMLLPRNRVWGSNAVKGRYLSLPAFGREHKPRTRFAGRPLTAAKLQFEDFWTKIRILFKKSVANQPPIKNKTIYTLYLTNPICLSVERFMLILYSFRTLNNAKTHFDD